MTPHSLGEFDTVMAPRAFFRTRLRESGITITSSVLECISTKVQLFNRKTCGRGRTGQRNALLRGVHRGMVTDPALVGSKLFIHNESENSLDFWERMDDILQRRYREPRLQTD